MNANITAQTTTAAIAKVGQARTDAAVELATTIATSMIAKGVPAEQAMHMAADFASKLATRQFASAAAMIAAAKLAA